MAVLDAHRSRSGAGAEDHHAADEHLGVAEELEGAGHEARAAGSGSNVATKGATGAMPIRQATRSRGPRSGKATSTTDASARRPARWATATAPATVASLGIESAAQRRRPTARVPPGFARRPWSTAALAGWSSSVGVGGGQHRAAGPRPPERPRRGLGRGPGRGCTRRPPPPRRTSPSRRRRRPSATMAGGRWRRSTASIPGARSKATGALPPAAMAGWRRRCRRPRPAPADPPAGRRQARRAPRPAGRRRGRDRLARPRPSPSTASPTSQAPSHPPGTVAPPAELVVVARAPSPSRTAPARRAGTAPSCASHHGAVSMPRRSSDARRASMDVLLRLGQPGPVERQVPGEVVARSARRRGRSSRAARCGRPPRRGCRASSRRAGT